MTPTPESSPLAPTYMALPYGNGAVGVLYQYAANTDGVNISKHLKCSSFIPQYTLTAIQAIQFRIGLGGTTISNNCGIAIYATQTTSNDEYQVATTGMRSCVDMSQTWTQSFAVTSAIPCVTDSDCTFLSGPGPILCQPNCYAPSGEQFVRTISPLNGPFTLFQGVKYFYCWTAVGTASTNTIFVSPANAGFELLGNPNGTSPDDINNNGEATNNATNTNMPAQLAGVAATAGTPPASSALVVLSQ